MKSPTVPLGDVVTVQSGFAFRSDLFSDSDGLPLIRIRDVVSGTTKTRYTGPYNKAFLVRAGEIIVGMDGEFNCGKWRSEPALLNQRVCKITPCDKRLDRNYLFHALPSILKAIESATPFVTVKHLSTWTLLSARIPLPPIPEQRRIAAILDHAHGLLAMRQVAIKQLPRLGASLLDAIIGTDVLSEQRLVPLGELIAFGPQNGLYRSAQHYGSGTPIVRIDSIHDGQLVNCTSVRLKVE